VPYHEPPRSYLATFFAVAHRFFCACEIFRRAAFDSFLRLRTLTGGRTLPSRRASRPASTLWRLCSSFSIVAKMDLCCARRLRITERSVDKLSLLDLHDTEKSLGRQRCKLSQIDAERYHAVHSPPWGLIAQSLSNCLRKYHC
jgi:hypothetical protein